MSLTMIRALMQKLGLDRIGDLVADQVQQAQVVALREEREVLARLIAKLDERIAGLGAKRRGRPPNVTSALAAVPTSRPRRRKRIVHASGETLRDMVVKALSKSGGPVKATALVELVRELGYRTTAKPSTLLTSIYHVLADTKVFRRMGKGVYGLEKGPPGTKGTKSRPKGRTTTSNRVLEQREAGNKSETKTARTRRGPARAGQPRPARPHARQSFPFPG